MDIESLVWESDIIQSNGKDMLQKFDFYHRILQIEIARKIIIQTTHWNY